MTRKPCLSTPTTSARCEKCSKAAASPVAAWGEPSRTTPSPTNLAFAWPCLQIQLAVPPGYSRNGVPVTRNFTFHACLGPTSRQQVGAAIVAWLSHYCCAGRNKSQGAGCSTPQDVLRLCGITQLLDASLHGYNSTVLAYGQTGSGKTFTMAGQPGEGRSCDASALVEAEAAEIEAGFPICLLVPQMLD